MAVNYTYAKRDGLVELVPEGNIPMGSTQATQQEYQNYINSTTTPSGMSWNDYYARNDTPGLKEAHQTAMAGGTPVFGGVDAEGDIVRTDQIATRQANEQAVASGQNREISPGLSVPVGSAADLSLQGKTQDQQLATPTVQTQILQQGLDPQSPSTVTQNDIRNGVPSPYAGAASYTGPSIVDFLVAAGQPSDFNSRAQLASQYGIQNYTGTAAQNTELLSILRNIPSGSGTSAIGSGPQPVNTIVPQNSLAVTPTGMVPGAAPAVGTEASKSIDQYIKELTPPQSETEKKSQALTDRLSQLIGDTAGQEKMLAEEEKARGVEELNKQLTAKNNEIKMLIAEREALNVDNMGKPMTMNSIIGANAQVNAVIDSKIFYRTAEAQALMGNIELARESAQRAVDAKYGPILEELRIKQAQLELLQPQLNKEERVRAEALDRQYQAQQQAIAEKRADERMLTSTLLDTMERYPDAGIRLTDTVEQANTKVKTNSAIYRDEVRPPQWVSESSSNASNKSSINNSGTADTFEQWVTQMRQTLENPIPGETPEQKAERGFLLRDLLNNPEQFRAEYESQKSGTTSSTNEFDFSNL